MAEKKMSLEEFKERVVKLMISEYAPHKSEEFLRECVDDEYFADIIHDGYNRRYGLEAGIDYAAYNISMCI